MSIFLAIIFLSLILLLHELGHFVMAKISGVKVEEFGFGFPPRIWSKKIGQTEYSLNWLPFGGLNKINLESFNQRSAGRRFIILFGGIFANIFLGWLLFSLIFMIGSQPLLMIGEVASGSPAELSGLQTGDKIISVISKKETLESPFLGQKFIEFVNHYRGDILTLKINRAGKIINFQAMSRENPPVGEGALGVTIIDIGVPAKSFGQSIIEGLKTTGLIIRLTFSGIYQLVTQAFLKPEILNALVGPVGAVALAGQVGKAGFIYLLQIMALLSVGFAVFNFLPFPALDGGHLLFVLIERVKGSPVPARLKSLINAFGFSFLLILMFFITVKDIKGLL